MIILQGILDAIEDVVLMDKYICCCHLYLPSTFRTLAVPSIISESYGKDMGLKSKDPIVFPYEMSALLNAMGMIWNFKIP